MDSETEERLKNALAASDFAEAQRLVPAYGEEAVALLSTARTDQEREQVMESFHNLLSLARVTRAHVSSQLAAVNRDTRYQVAAPATHTWRFEA